jgi:hypothetical protein
VICTCPICRKTRARVARDYALSVVCLAAILAWILVMGR